MIVVAEVELLLGWDILWIALDMIEGPALCSVSKWALELGRDVVTSLCYSMGFWRSVTMTT